MSYINKYAVLLTEGKFEESFVTAKQGYDLDPDSVIGNRIMGFAHFYKEQYAEATRYLEFASKLSNYAAFNQVDLITLYSSMGLLEKARTVMEDLKLRITAGKYVSSCIMSFAYGFLGDIDLAINWLEKAYEAHDAYLCILQYYPFAPDALRQDSRFKSFIRKMNFP
jgi:tetratricopeptide (TPR) repeat protein